jgi:CheY-like chemotaxis protein
MAVLLVEDDPVIRLTIADFLEETGLLIWEADNAKDALMMLDDPVREISVLVTDLGLGPGDDGLDLAAKAKGRLPHLQVVYETGSPEKLAGRSLAPWERVFLKPFDMTALSGVVCALDRQMCQR